MKKNSQILKIDKSVVDYIERLDYEQGARKGLIAFMISSNMDISTEAFHKYQDELLEYQIKFDTAKHELEEKYILPIIGDNKVNWSLNYRNQELIIDYL